MTTHKTHAQLSHDIERWDVELDLRLRQYFNRCVFVEPPESQAERLNHQEHDFD